MFRLLPPSAYTSVRPRLNANVRLALESNLFLLETPAQFIDRTSNAIVASVTSA